MTTEDTETSGGVSTPYQPTVADGNAALEGKAQVGEDGISRTPQEIIDETLEAEGIAEATADDLKKTHEPFKGRQNACPFKYTEPDMGKLDPNLKGPPSMMEEGTEDQMAEEKAKFEESMVGKNARHNVGAREAEPLFGGKFKDIWEHRNHQLRLLEERESE